MNKIYTFFILLILNFNKAVYACPGCKDLIKYGEESIKKLLFGNGIAWSMALMFAVPATIVGLIMFAVFKSEKKFHESEKREQVR